jgi:hypothetical protein
VTEDEIRQLIIIGLIVFAVGVLVGTRLWIAFKK